ncbi:MAG: insulinase family protein [Chlorobi bacterium]|nr:insulinase family protein [Chlorobiota bacterium]
MKSFIRFFVLIQFILFSSVSLFSQNYPLDDPIQRDPDVVVGQLDNGLKYYIRQNHKPEKRVEFRLVVNAGSVLEDDDQQGLAHFVEHMAFNGSKDFSKNDLVNFLEESGVDFGPDLNAYTSFDQTVYMFQIPSDRQGLLDSAFMILENWAHELSFDPVEIDKERGVVHEEWRLGLGADDRMMKKYIPVLLKDSRYAERLPIGKMSVIDSCPYSAITRFYGDWYRPDLMAVVVVGDITPMYAEQQIKEHFAGMKNPDPERERVMYNIPNNGQPLVSVATDKEATYTTVAMFRKMNKFYVKTNDNYRTKIKFNLFISMLNERLFGLTQEPDAPFVYAGASYGGFLARSLDAYTMYAMVKENRVDDAIESLVQVNKQIKRYGFTENELERQKADMIKQLDKKLSEKNKTESRRFVNKYIDNFLNQEPFPGIDYEAAFTKSVLPDIKLDAINQVAYYFAKNNGLVVLVTGPEKEGVEIPNEEEVLATLQKAREAEVETFKEETVGESLIENPLPGGTIIDQSENEKFGITEIKLNNGVTVVLKPTTFKNDEILMTSYGFGGTSVVPDDDFISAVFTSQIISQSGVGDFDRVSLKKFLTGKNVSAHPQIGKISQGISGKSGKKDMETMFQLAYLYFTQPRKDTAAFKTFKSQMSTQFKFMMANPQAVFYDTLYKLATQNDPRTIVIPTEEQINSIDLDKAYSFYKKLFDNANGYTFVFTGSFSKDTILPMITKYLGSLPSQKGGLTWRDVSPEFPPGITEAVVHKGTEPKSMVAIMMDEPFTYDPETRLKMNMLVKILNIRMRESMREDQGGVYGVRARQNMTKYPKEEINLLISWGCAPENVDKLVQTVFLEMDTLIANGPNEVNLLKAKETAIRDYETNFEKNNYWLNKIKNAYYYNENLIGLDELKAKIRAVTADELKEMANRYFNEDNYLKVILMPEEKK